MPRDITDRLVVYLKDAHSIEEQALTQLRHAPQVAGVPSLARMFEDHAAETEVHEQLVTDRLAAYDTAPSKVKDAVMKAGGAGFLLFAAVQPDTPGKLVAHAHSYEALELASYELLMRVAGRAGDDETVAAASRIRDQEEAMRDRLATTYDEAAAASLEKIRDDDPESRVATYLADAHALEAQAIQLLEKGPKIAGDDTLAAIYADHLEETRGQQALVEARLDAHDAPRSALKDAGLRLGALNWGTFFQTQRDTPGKLAAFAYAFEHLEIAGYELLARVAGDAGDTETVAAAERILAQERAAAVGIAGAFDRAADASLDAAGVA